MCIYTHTGTDLPAHDVEEPHFFSSHPVGLHAVRIPPLLRHIRYGAEENLSGVCRHLSSVVWYNYHLPPLIHPEGHPQPTLPLDSCAIVKPPPPLPPAFVSCDPHGPRPPLHRASTLNDCHQGTETYVPSFLFREARWHRLARHGLLCYEHGAGLPPALEIY